jgi:putative nucleotidyltransferase with HDIG domain
MDQLSDTPPSSAGSLSRRAWSTEVALAASFLVVAIAMATLLHRARPLEVGPAIVLVLAYAVLSRVRFQAGTGHTVPTQLVLVTMLLTLPTPVVPLLVLAGILAANVPEFLRGAISRERLVLLFGDAWHAVGPALVLIAASAQEPSLGNWPWFLLALLAQFGVDLAVSSLRASALGYAPRLQLGVLAWVWLIDALLAPLGLLAAIATQRQSYAFALVLPLAAVLEIFARERSERIEHAVELGNAYRGIAMLLGDLLEDADEYTGRDHTLGVVALSLQVCDELGLDQQARRNVEFAALLHDIGKILIPNDIINKTGPLDDEEWAVMKRHTIDAQRMLDRVGGALRDVGRIVRASHERWDGEGYPDGLGGSRIPREATIVCACDAFNAMTTDRSYRRARGARDALDELRAHSGTQFNPEVVAALIRVVERTLPDAQVSAAAALSAQPTASR